MDRVKGLKIRPFTNVLLLNNGSKEPPAMPVVLFL